MAQKFNPPFGSGGKSATKPMAKAPMQVGGMGGDAGAGTGMNEEQDGGAVAQEHGPAVEVNISHEHEMGSHHVRSSHPDGHMHESDHGSAEEAHDHGKKLAGVGEMEEKHAEPDGDESEPWGK